MRKPLNEERLHELALFYVGRFATTRAKLIAYLSRKLRERGWEGERQPTSSGWSSGWPAAAWSTTPSTLCPSRAP